MKKSVMRTAAFVTAVMLAGTACPALTVSADKNVMVSASAVKDSGMEAALKTVKQRVKVPAELSEFTYSTHKGYNTVSYTFNWSTPSKSKEQKNLRVEICGNVITDYRMSFDARYGEPKLAKLSEEKLIEKAKEYVKQLDPDVYPKVKFELQSLELRSDMATVSFQRYENDIPVSRNEGYVTLNKNTGELIGMETDWYSNAEFSDPKSVLSDKEIKAAYEKLCTLTPYYRISYKWDSKTKKSYPEVNIVYTSDSSYELDPYTGKKSTIWDDMREAGGSSSASTAAGYDAGEGYEEEEEVEEEGEGVVFTPEELKKIEQNSKLLSTDKVFGLLKNDKFVALSDSYKLKSYNIYSFKDNDGKENFNMYLSYTVDENKKDSLKNYYNNITVTVDAETGAVKNMNKWGLTKSDGSPLDVKAASAVAEEAAKKYSKDIFSQYKAAPENSKPVNIWYDSSGRVHYETSRSFVFNRYVNGIRVWGDYIRVSVDSSNTVTSYSVNHTKNVTFPKADILGKSEAFKKLYEQQKFEYSYKGWTDKDGKVHTYLIAYMPSYILNAKTGKLASWDGSELKTYKSPRDVKYTDIKGIPQEEAILAMQKYGVAVTTNSKLEPDKPITEEEFTSLLAKTLNYAAAIYDEDVVEEEYDEESGGSVKKKDENDKTRTTREEAAVIFASFYDRENISEISGIFRTPFSDVSASNPNIGRIAIAYGKGFMPKTADGKFGGSKVITRAEAVQMIYDYLKVLSK